MRKGKLYISFLLGLCLCLFTALFTSCKDEKPAPTLSTISVLGETEVFIDEFDYADYTITATYSDNSTKTATLTADNLSADDNAKLSTVGTHSLTVSYESVTYSWTVTLKNHDFAGLTFDDITTTYDGTAKTLAVSGLPTGAQVSYDKETSYTNAGTYTVKATVTLANYNPVELTATLTINKATYDMSAVAFADKTVTYNGESHSIEATNLPNGVTAEYTGNNQINAGEYEITATFTGDSQNYELIADKTATLTIEKATIMGITFTGAEYTYDGKVKSLAIAGTLPDGVTVSYTGNNQTNAGEHPVTATFSKNANYNNLSDMQATLKIKKATYDMSAVVFKDKSVNYTGEAYSIEATNLPNGVSVRYDGNNKTQAGEYTVTAIFTGDSVNYNAIPNMTATLKISASDLTGISFNDGEFTYDGQPKSLAITGTLPDGVKVSYENNGQVNADSYTVKATFTCTNGNYTNLPELTATLTIKKATYDMSGVLFKDKSVNYNGQAHSIEATNLPNGVSVRYDGNNQTQAGEYTVTAIFTGDSRNYNEIPNMTATLKINASDLTGISFNDGEFTYDGTKKSIYITGELPDGVKVDYTNNEQINADSYTVTATFTCTNGNYINLPELTATLTIKKAVYDMSAVVFADKTVTYDGQAHSIEATNLPQGVTAQYTGNKQINAGEYEITATFKGDSANYELIASQTATLTIEQRELTLAFDGETTLKYNGNAQKTITVQATNLVNGDSVELTVSYNGAMIEAGEYIATATLTAHQNYKLTANNTVKVTITRATHTVTFKQDGVADIVKEVLDLADLTDIPQPKTVDGYKFTWDRKDFTSITEDITVTAQKTLLTYEIEYVLNGGTDNGNNPTQYTVESATFTLKAPTASETFGTTFGGWYTSPDFSLDSKITKIAKGTTGDLKLYAYWLEYRVTEVVGGTVDYSQATPELTIKVDYGTTNLAVKDLISVSDGCTWKLYTGFECLPTQELTAKRLTVSNVGDNIFYILVFHPDSDEYYTDYVLNVYQLDMKTYTFLKDGETWASGEIQEESALNAPENPEKDGYTFDGWKVNGEFVSFPYTVLTDTEFVAVYTPIEYTVTFKPNGGTVNQLTRTYTIETGMTFENPTREHYVFKGWYNSETQEDAVTGIKIGTWGDFEFYAKWTPTVYRINYYLNGGSWTSGSTVSATYTIESPTITLPTPTKTGYTFAGWFTETTFENQATEITLGSHGNKKFYAKWTPTAYTIEYELNGGENEESNTKTYNIEQAYTLKNPTRAGYTFEGWFTEETFENQTTGIALGSYGNKKFYAKWTANLNTLKFDGNGATGGSMSAMKLYTDETKALTANAFLKHYYHFIGWALTPDGDVVYADGAEYTMGTDSEYTLYAVWEYGTNGIQYSRSGNFYMVSGYSGTERNVGIPSAYNGLPVTSIGYDAFYNCDSLTSVEIPDSVTSIGSYAFYNCSSLTSIYYKGTIEDWCNISGVSNLMAYGSSSKNLYLNNELVTELVIPNAVTEIKSYAFRGCSSLTSVIIGDSVTSIGKNAFRYCSSLTSIEIPDSVTNIGDSAFYSCSSLTSVVIGDSVTSIGYSAFDYCSSLTTVKYMGDIASWCNISFGGVYANPMCYAGELYINNALITELEIPNAVTEIKAYAFSGCSRLTSVEIPDSVTSIGGSAFRACSGLTSVVIGNGVTSIGNSAFSGCDGLTSIMVDENNTAYASQDGILYNKEKTQFICIPANLSGDITIPNSVTSIGKYAFSDCSSLTSVEIPDSVTSIGSSAFEGCSSLIEMTIPFVGASKDTTGYQAVFGYIFGYTTSSSSDTISGATYQYYDSSSSSSYKYYHYYIPTSLRKVTITGGNIGDKAFYNCSSLTSVVIPDGVTSIGEGAFDSCDSLTSVVIPDGVTSIGYEAFSSCDSLTSVVIPDGVTSIGERAFSNCSSLTSVTIPDSVTSIGYEAFRYCSSLTSVIIPDSVTSIGYRAFYYCSNLTSVVIPDSVTSIGSYAFYNCSSLTNIEIPDSVTSIGSGAFGDCSSLTNIEIPDSVTSIGSGAFGDCSSLTEITLPFVGASKDTTGYQAVFGYIFGYTTSSSSSTISGATYQYYDSSSSSSYKYYHYYIPTSLKKVTITGGNIGSSAFLNCDSLTSVVIGNSVTSIGNSAFEDCDSLTSVYITDIEAWCNISFGNAYANPLSNGASLYLNNELVTELVIPNTVTEIKFSAFYSCSSLTSVVIGDGVTSIGKSAFAYCSSLTSIEIPDGVTSIGDYVFYSCSSLTSVVIGDGVTGIGEFAFEDCDSLTIYCEAVSEPSGWDSRWNYSNCTVVWGVVTQTYRFDSNGGSAVENKETIFLTTLPSPTKDGWYFGGWYDNADLTGSPVSSPYYSATKTTLYAKWLTEEEYIAYYDGSSFEKAIQAEVGGSYTVTIDTAGEKVYYKFTATESKSYTIKSSGGLDTYGYLYNSSQSQLTYNDGSTDFTITRSLTAGETYYVVVKMYSSSATGTFTLTIS